MSESLRRLVEGFRRFARSMARMLRRFAEALKRIGAQVRVLVVEATRRDAEQAAYEDWAGILWSEETEETREVAGRAR